MAASDAGQQGAAKTTRIGGFEILEKLGEGGMGAVYKARQVSMDRLVALKILPKKLAEDERFVQRFLREARSAGKLRHPNIVEAFDTGCIEGHYFFAMEFVDGETLSQIVARDGPLEPDRALGIMKQVCGALAAAHEAGIVHRDIKPSNIMIDKKGEARVTDFGLAKRTEGDIEATADGAVVGTPAYVAPEMAKGGEVDARSDLYSLGATIFCTLAGRPPFAGKSFAEVLVKQATEAPPPLATLAPRVDRRLCHIIDRLLRKDPDARYPSAKALLDDLNGLGKLQSIASAARAEGRAMLRDAPTLEMTEGQRAARDAGLREQRHRSNRTTLVTVGAIVAILAIVGIILATRRPRGAATRPATEKTTVAKPPDEKTRLPVFVDDEEAKLKAERARIAKTRQQYDECVRAADAAIAQNDYEKARAAMQPALSLGVPGLAELARSKVAEIDALEKNAAGAEKLMRGEWVELFDGKTLDGWRVVEEGRFAGHGRVAVENGCIGLEPGAPCTGIAATREMPTTDYELSLEGMRVAGGSDLCSVALPVGASHCALVVGGHGGQVVGLESIDGRWGHGSPAHVHFSFELARWYQVRLRVTQARIQVWVDEQKLLDTERAGHEFTLWAPELKPLGIYSSETRATLRNIRLRRLGPGPEAEVKARLQCRLLATLTGHTDWVTSVAFSPDGTRVASASRDRTLKLWDAATGKDLKTFQGHLDGVESVAFSPDGQRLASASYDGTVRLWEVDTGRCVATLDHQRIPLHAVAFVADGKSVVSGSEDGLIKLWDIATEKCLKTMTDPVGRMQVQSLALAQDGKRVLSGGKDPALRLWDLTTGACLRKQPGLSPTAWCVGLSPDGLRMLSVGDEPAVRVWSTDTGAPLRVLPTPSPNRGVSFSPDGRWIAASAWQGWLHVWDAATYELLVSVQGHQRDIFKHAFSPDSKRLATAGFDSLAKVWELVPPGPAEEKPLAKAGEWVSLFDGKTLDGWSVVKKFVSIAPQDGDGTGGEVYVKDGWLVLEPGRPMTGIAWTRAFPETDYEVELEAMRLQGFCDFASFTFPAGQEHCTFHGACHAQFVGLSRVDGRQCHENGTGRAIRYENGRWYRIRLQVTAARVRAWIDEAPVVDFARAGRALAPHAPEVRPFGVWNWMGKSAVRSVRVRRIAPPPQDKEPPPEPPPKPLALPPGGEWLSLFDGKTLDGWRVVPFLPGPLGGRGGTAEVRDGHIVLGAGMPFTAIAWTGGFPTSDYEVRVEATRILGRDDFCTIVFPLGATGCIWVVGGCRGSGIEVLDNANAAWNETAERLVFQQGRPSQVRLRVTKARLEGWIDDEKVFDTLTAGHTFALRDFAQPVTPFGIFTWNTSAALRNIAVRAITPRPDDGPPPDEPPAGAKPAETATVAVAARANWFDTGLYVTQGKAYELSASGQWGTDPTWPACGAEGMPGRPNPNYPLVGAGVVFNLIGRVGALGRPFHVGERRALTPETTGRLYLRMNDCITGDNWGSLRVAVAGPLLADADAPLLARFTNEVRKLDLDAKSDWADSGVAVQLGDKLLIAAAGTWQAGALLPPTNADGYREALAFLRRGALVGKIGEQGRPFHVGQLLLLEATKAGNLYLAMNDDARDENQGSLAVTISSPPKPKLPDGKAEAPPPPLPKAP